MEWLRKLFIKKRQHSHPEFIEIKRETRYVIVMEVPSDLSGEERRILMNAASDMRDTLNEWIASSEERFFVVMTINGLPIKLIAVDGDKDAGNN